MYQGNTLAQALRAASVGREEATFAIDQDSQQSISYGALWNEAERIASALVALGVQPQDRVAVQIEKSVTAIALYLGTVLCGAIHLPLNTAYTSAEVSYFLTDASPRVFVGDPAKLAALTPVAQAAGVQCVLSLDAQGAGSLSDAAAKAAPLPKLWRVGLMIWQLFFIPRAPRAAQRGRSDAWQPDLERRGAARSVAVHRARCADPRLADLPHPWAVCGAECHVFGRGGGCAASRL